MTCLAENKRVFDDWLTDQERVQQDLKTLNPHVLEAAKWAVQQNNRLADGPFEEKSLVDWERFRWSLHSRCPYSIIASWDICTGNGEYESHEIEFLAAILWTTEARDQYVAIIDAQLKSREEKKQQQEVVFQQSQQETELVKLRKLAAKYGFTLTK